MGREIRKVPPGWAHPKDDRGRFVPMFDQSFRDAADKWCRNFSAWADGSHESLVEEPALKEKYPYFWQWEGDPPDETSYRPHWPDGSATCIQIYETVTEGTPVSPVFASPEEAIAWLVQPSGTGDPWDMQGMTREQAERFVRAGWAPSGIYTPDTGFVPGFRVI